MLRELTVTVTNDFMIARSETISPKEDRVVTTYANQKAQAVPASTFEFKPPAEVKVTTPLGK